MTTNPIWPTGYALVTHIEVSLMVYIRRNVLLRGADKTMSIDEAKAMTLMLADDEVLAPFRERFGEAGLYRIMMMTWYSPTGRRPTTR